MACKVEWFVRAPRPITAAEHAAYVALSEAEQARSWQVGRFVLLVLGGGGGVIDIVAGGSTEMPDDVTHADWALLLDALTRMRTLVGDAICEVRDDHSLIAWNDEHARYETTGWVRPPQQAPVLPVRDETADETAVRAAYAEILAAGHDGWKLRDKLDAFPPEVVVRVGLALLPVTPAADYRTGHPGPGPIASGIADAAPKLADAAAVDAAIGAIWDSQPGAELARHLASSLEPIADQPNVRDRAIRAAASPATERDLRIAAITLLGRARRSAELVVPILVARAREDRQTAMPAPWRGELLAALEMLRRRDGFATLLLEADGRNDLLWRIASALPRCDVERALPFLVRMREVSEVSQDHVVRAIAEVPGPAATDALLAYAEHPSAEVRALVADKLIQRGRLVEVAAIWQTLDAAGFTSYLRPYALRAFGHEDQPTVDWAALVRARGEQPLVLGAPSATPPAASGYTFALSVAERAALDEQEAAIAASARVREVGADGPPAPPGGDAFDGSHPEARGDVLADDAGLGLQQRPGYLAPRWTAADGVVDVPDGQAVGEIRAWDEASVGLWFAAIVRRRTRWLRFDAFELVLRDAEHRPLHVMAAHPGKLLGHPARVGVDGNMTRAAYAAARTADMRAIVREPFQLRAGRWRIGAFDRARCVEVPLAAVDDAPVPELPGLARAVTARATLNVVPIQNALELHLVVELALAAPARAITPVQVAVVFRDARGDVLDRNRFDVVLPADGSSVLERRLFGMRVAPAETLEILVRGARTLNVLLATFALDGTITRIDR